MVDRPVYWINDYPLSVLALQSYCLVKPGQDLNSIMPFYFCATVL